MSKKSSKKNNNITGKLNVKELSGLINEHVVGQVNAINAVALGVIMRERRGAIQNKELQDEITPKNILMTGPTGVGKTEIARRLAKVINAPFIKVDATKFTEVGYVGKDVDSIIRDLIENAINITKSKMRAEVQEQAKEAAIKRILDVLVGANAQEATVQLFRKKLESGELDDQEIQIDVIDTPPPQPGMSMLDLPGMPGAQMGVGVLSIGDMLKKAIGIDKNTKLKKLLIPEAMKIIIREESDKIIEEEKIIEMAIEATEQRGIVFIDEIDKIIPKADGRGGDVSREGVQRDLLPLIEGTTVSTKYGPIKTDYILFIASGAFHIAKPSDLLPELQGRLPIRVELHPLTEKDLARILKEPQYNLLKQYQALLATENVKIKFTEDAIDKIAELSAKVNKDVENIGARRLHTVLEKVLEDINYRAGADKSLEKETITINAEYVEGRLKDLVTNVDLSKFIL